MQPLTGGDDGMIRGGDSGTHYPRARRRQAVGTPDAHDPASLQ